MSVYFKVENKKGKECFSVLFAHISRCYLYSVVEFPTKNGKGMRVTERDFFSWKGVDVSWFTLEEINRLGKQEEVQRFLDRAIVKMIECLGAKRTFQTFTEFSKKLSIIGYDREPYVGKKYYTAKFTKVPHYAVSLSIQKDVEYYVKELVLDKRGCYHMVVIEDSFGHDYDFVLSNETGIGVTVQHCSEDVSVFCQHDFPYNYKISKV